MSKINFNASGEQMTDEVHSDVGAGEFSLDHSVFLQSGFLCSRLSGGTQPLTYGVDYILTSINERLRTEAGLTSYQKVKVLNATYQTGALYFTYKAVADFIEAEDWSNADTLDGATKSTDGTFASNSDSKIPTEKAVKTYANGTTGTGYTKLPGGIIFQWGRILLSAGTSGGSVTFPIPFTVKNSMSVIIQEQGVNLSEKVGVTSVPSLTGFNYNYVMSDETYVFWIAIGY